ncbi:hypothetical protein L1987_54350 [Smallanthus sonchifolius]|uniref:Uncharacterized protein n=1 Tax=Smallanthus sonchifolius TaxID=185202 RepID=A0ACB9E6L5_9ASTR|nr:hypothetical protein L1987_54350 [Smallanthus sonchifolius]
MNHRAFYHQGFEKTKVRFYNCQEYGHFAKECVKSKVEFNSQKKPNNFQNNRNQSHGSSGSGNSNHASASSALVAQNDENYDWGIHLEDLVGTVSQAFVAEIHSAKSEESTDDASSSDGESLPSANEEHDQVQNVETDIASGVSEDDIVLTQNSSDGVDSENILITKVFMADMSDPSKLENFENSSVVLDYFNANVDPTKRVAGIGFVPPPFNANYVVEPEIIHEEEIDPKTVLKVNPVTGEDIINDSDSEDEVFDDNKVEGIPKEVQLDETKVVKNVTRDSCILTEPDEVKVDQPKLSKMLQSSGFVAAGHQKKNLSTVTKQVFVQKKPVNCSVKSSEDCSSEGSSNSRKTPYILIHYPYKNQGKLKSVSSQQRVVAILKRPNMGKPTSSVVKNVPCQSFAKSSGFKQHDKHISKPVVFQNNFEIPHVGIPNDSQPEVKLSRPQRRRRNRKLKKFLEISESDNHKSNNGQPRRTINNTWYVDSGCSRHMTGNIRLLEDVIHIDGGYVAFAFNKGEYITGQGTLKNDKVKFEKVNYVEQLEHNLLSVSQLCDKKFSFHFNDSECYILKPGFVIHAEWILMKASRRNDTYVLDMSVATTTDSIPTCLLSKASESDSILWHRKLAHINYRKMNYLVKNDLVIGVSKMKFSVPDDCIPCKKGKQHKKSHKSKSKNSIVTPLELLHIDLFVPISIRSIGGKSYCLVVTDAFSRFSWVKFLASKAETTELVQFLILGLENFCKQKVRSIRSDNGSEFKNSKMGLFCLQKGIHHEFSAPYVPQQNGVAERNNRTLVETARTMLVDSKLPVTFWPEAINTACHFSAKAIEGIFLGYVANSTTKRVYNKETRQVEEWFHIDCSNRSLPQMAIGPDWAFDYENLFKSFQLPSDISPEEAVVLYVSCQDAQNSGFQPTMVPQPGFQPTMVPQPSVPSTSALNPNVASCSGPQESDSEDENVIFQDSSADPLLVDEPSNLTQAQGEMPTNLDSEIPVNQDMSYQSDTTQVDMLPVPEVASIKELKVHPISNIIGNLRDGVQTRSIIDNTCLYIGIKNSGVLDVCSHSYFISQVKPKNVEMAVRDNNWIEAMQEELAQFDKLKVWNLVDLPKGVYPIGTKWVFKCKKDDRGVVVRNKARLVVQGFNQQKGIDYTEVYAPVARLEAIQLFLAFASYKGFKVFQLDVKSASLYGKFKEEVYVCQPPGFEDPTNPSRVFKLDKALYGLHQAPRACYETLSTHLMDNDFVRGQIDSTLFIKKQGKNIYWCRYM